MAWARALAQRWRDRLWASWWPLLAQHRPLPFWARWPVAALAAIYGAVWRWRLRRLTSAPALETPVPVVVVGNPVVGGAGKTPVVMALAALFREAGFAVGVISRGYGGAATAPQRVVPDSDPALCGDEPVLIARRTGVPVWVGRDRPAALAALLAAHPGTQIVISDDGAQHLPLRRSCVVWVLDERGVGNGRLLPAGPLREPWPQALRADARRDQTGASGQPAPHSVIYNAPAASAPEPGFLAERTLQGPVPWADWQAGQWTRAATCTDGAEDLPSASGPAPLALAGLAHPDKFFALLRARGLNFVPAPLPDHASWDDAPWLKHPAWREGTPLWVTEKDAVKLRPWFDRGELPPTWVWPLAFDLPQALADELLAWAQRP